jgi:dTDP-4-dehydrorhamnose reductase
VDILLTGPAGQIGWELRRTLAPLGTVHAVGRATRPLAADLSDSDALRAAVRAVRPQLIVNAAAYTAVDRAEQEPGLAMAVNAEAPGVLAEEAARIGAAFIHYSTDYVFDGRAAGPYGEDDPTAPLGVYGTSKLAGERAVQALGGAWWILRTSWIYGARGGNFLRTLLRLGAEREVLRVVDDQRGAPTWSRMVAEVTAQMLVRAGAGGTAPAEAVGGSAGVYHLSCAGETTWCRFARAIFAQIPKAPRIEPITTDQWPTPARRPPYSVLAGDRLAERFGLRLPPWKTALECCLEDMGYPPPGTCRDAG